MNKLKSIHFVGIGGIGISSLAQHFLALNIKVTGSDLVETPLTKLLESLGATVYYTHDKANVASDVDLVVYSSAVKDDNCELQEAQKRNIPTILREVLLGQVFNTFEKKVAICGVHGKTTVTSMIDFVLRNTDISHTSFVGGILCDTNTNYTKGQDIVLAEACEYKKSFLNLFPDITVALNVEHDHPDYYKTEADIETAFGEFFRQSKLVVACGDSINKTVLKSAENLITFGFGKENHYTAQNLKRHKTHYSFDFFYHTHYITTVNLHSEGKHNVLNAMATLVVCNLLGLSFASTAEGLKDFCGTERRFMHVPCKHFSLVEDYAHHPTEITATLDTAKCFNYKKIYAVFQPHTYTRTQVFWQKFIDCFEGATEVMLLPIYSAREKEIENINSANLCRDINTSGNLPCLYFDTYFEAYYHLINKAQPDDLVLVLGAGDIYKLTNLLKD